MTYRKHLIHIILPICLGIFPAQFPPLIFHHLISQRNSTFAYLLSRNNFEPKSLIPYAINQNIQLFFVNSLQNYYIIFKYANILCDFCNFSTIFGKIIGILQNKLGFSPQNVNYYTKQPYFTISYKPHKPKHKLFFHHPPIYQRFT